MAGTGQKVVSPQFMAAYRPDLVILMNPLYRQEVQASLAQMGLAPQILSVGESGANGKHHPQLERVVAPVSSVRSKKINTVSSHPTWFARRDSNANPRGNMHREFQLLDRFCFPYTSFRLEIVWCLPPDHKGGIRERFIADI